MQTTALCLAAFATLLALVVPFYAWRERGRSYAVAAAVILTLSFPACLVVGWHLASAFPDADLWINLGFGYGFAAAAGHLASLVRARLRPRLFRWLVSIPGMTWIAAGMLSLLVLLALIPFRLLAVVLGAEIPAWILALELSPFAVALFSVSTSLRSRHEFVHIVLGGDLDEAEHALRRVPVKRRRSPHPVAGSSVAAGAGGIVGPGETPLGAPPDPRPPRLRLVQITDPHLGPWQPVHRLKRRVRSLLEHKPDLVLLTGDFLTMESRGTPGSLAEALAPLREAPGRCFAVFGNHDHEAPDEVRAGLEANGVHLLVDEEICVETAAGPVQIVGSDWIHREAGGHLVRLLGRFPRRPNHLRLVLLHDPAAFPALPSGEADLTLSGHTHGGQLGLVSMGLDWTVLSRTRWPDHGLFARGRNRLYVHRGTGFYGFPLRIGVPGESSLLEIVAPS